MPRLVLNSWAQVTLLPSLPKYGDYRHELPWPCHFKWYNLWYLNFTSIKNKASEVVCRLHPACGNAGWRRGVSPLGESGTPSG